jgi:hypothetical protein
MLQQKWGCFHNPILHIVGERVEIGMEALKENCGYVLWTGFNGIIIIGVLNGDRAVDVGAVGEVIDFNGGMMNKHRV